MIKNNTQWQKKSVIQVSLHWHLGWCHWAFSHCRHCKCKWLFGTYGKHSDARNWTAQWPSKCSNDIRMNLDPNLGAVFFFLIRNSPYRLVAMYHLNGPHSLLILHLVTVPCRVIMKDKFCSKILCKWRNESLWNLTTSMQTKILCSNVQISE